MVEKLFRGDEDGAFDAPARHVPVPGRMAATARLFPGALFRKARDANGVTAGAGDAVARASSSTGSALPSEVRTKFEGSLGADLSSVRVHTGAASAEAASAVGARAYTVGNDIHFADGQFTPSDPFGLHLLAHEVAHTQQQAGAAPVRQHKLAVSGPGDAAEIEADRAADAMVSGASASLAMVGAGIQREPMKTCGKDETDADSSKSATDASIEREFTEELRRQAGVVMSLSFTKFVDAANAVQKEMNDKKAQPTLVDMLLEMAVGSLAPGLADFALSRVRDGLKSMASAAIGKYVKDGEKAVTTYLKADDLLDKVKLTDEKAKAGFKALRTAAAPKTQAGGAGATAPPTATPPVGGAAAVGGTGGPIPVGTLIDTFKQNFSVYIQDQNAKLGTLDRDAVAGVYAAFDQNVVTTTLYTQQIRDLVKMHEEVTHAADSEGGWTGAGNDSHKIVMLSAWNVRQPAIVEFHPGAALVTMPYWSFVKWIEPDMMSTAIAAGQGQKGGLEEMTAGAGAIPLQGHIDDPNYEGERVLQVDMYGKTRLCFAKVQGGGQTQFLRWVPPEEETFARVKAQQSGGILDFNPGDFGSGHIPAP